VAIVIVGGSRYGGGKDEGRDERARLSLMDRLLISEPKMEGT